MKVYSYIISMVVFLLFSVNVEAIEKERTVKKSYKVNADTEIKIKNSFGKVDVESYDGDEVYIEVRVWAKGSSESKVDRFINSVEIEFDLSSDEVEVSTSNISNNGSVKKFKVDYKIKIPSQNYLKINNSFGDVEIGNHSGVVKLDVSHGNIYALDIKNMNNDIELQFGNADIKKYGSGKIELQHSNLDLNSTLDLKLKSEFSNTKIKEVVRTVHAQVSHGNLKIEEVNTKFDNIKIEAEFSKINLEMSQEISYNLEYRGSFTSFSKPNKLEVTTRDKDYNSEEISGIANGGGSLVNIKLSHSTLNLD